MVRLMSRFGLRFDDEATERQFVQHFSRSNLRWTQAAMILGAFVYTIFCVWDWILYPEILPTTLAIRGGVTLAVLLPLTALLSIPPAQRWSDAIFLIYCVVPGCVLSFIYLVIPTGFTHAAAGMILVILFVSTLLPLRLGAMATFVVTTWATFVFAESFAQDLPAGMRFINHFEIGNAYALSLYAVGAREYQARKQFRTAEALRLEKERSEASLAQLRDTQAHLVQAEKLASLGQLVAGVAHEVSTPLGLAITTSTSIESELRAMSATIDSPKVRRSDLTKRVERISEGLQLTFTNLNRASDVVQSFKQVAVDHASEERRSFEMREWLSELLTRLGPLISRRGMNVRTDVPDGIIIDGYPGVLAQVISSLALNAALHAFPDGRAGEFSVTVTQLDATTVRIVCADDGIGIPAEIRERVFDPFITTRRDRGSAGLGLHIAFNNVVSALGGRIELAAASNSGTRFTIDIPVRSDVEFPQHGIVEASELASR